MFPSAKDKILRIHSVVAPEAPQLANGQFSLQDACDYIIASLRHKFISREVVIDACIDITKPWEHPGFPAPADDRDPAMYVYDLQRAVYAELDKELTFDSSDVMVHLSRMLIVKDRFRSVFRIFVRAEVITTPIAA